MREARGQVRRLWCTLMHPAPMWPVGGYYRCPKCLHRYPVPWERKQDEAAAPREDARERRRPATPLPGARGWRSVFGH